MRLRQAAAALALASVLAGPAVAAELVMFETEGCPWCLKWHREVGPVYARTDEGRRLPLRRVDLRKTPPSVADVRISPTFVVLSCGGEVERIVGYNDAESFWGQVSVAAQRVTAERC
ncbi:MAG: thioredoxin family protein [Magnetospirillum sp.]|nr:thioredoxin family protein [Magnetospirillum sp.]